MIKKLSEEAGKEEENKTPVRLHGRSLRNNVLWLNPDN